MDSSSEESQPDFLVQETSLSEDVLPSAHHGLQRAPTQEPDAEKVPQAPVPNPRSVYTVTLRTDEGSVDALSVAGSSIAQLVQDRPDAGHGKVINVALLLKELDILRDSNSKLREALSERDIELQTLKLEQELHETASEADQAQRAAALVEEVYLAQRERDQAVMARLRLANEERDEAILRAKRLEQSLRQLEHINPEDEDTSVQELLSRVHQAESGAEIERNAAILVDRVHKTKERKKQITVEEMSAVIEERDVAMAQCKQLEQELHHFREKSQASGDMRHLTAAKHTDRAQKVQLVSLQHDRDMAMEEYKKLEEELQTLRVYYSLHQSLSQEVNMKEQFQSAMHTYEEALKNREQVLRITQQQNEALAVQAQQATCESAALEAKLQQAAATAETAADRVQKLERLVDVLRKKVGAGTLRTMI